MILLHTSASSGVRVTSNSTRFFLRSTSAPTEPLSSRPSRKRRRVVGLPSLSRATFAVPAMATQSVESSQILSGEKLTTDGPEPAGTIALSTAGILSQGGG